MRSQLNHKGQMHREGVALAATEHEWSTRCQVLRRSLFEAETEAAAGAAGAALARSTHERRAGEELAHTLSSAAPRASSASCAAPTRARARGRSSSGASRCASWPRMPGQGGGRADAQGVALAQAQPQGLRGGPRRVRGSAQGPHGGGGAHAARAAASIAVWLGETDRRGQGGARARRPRRRARRRAPSATASRGIFSRVSSPAARGSSGAAA